MTVLSRTARLRAALNESQDVFALRLGVSQGTVWRLEKGQKETGAQRILLDQIERELVAAADPSSRFAESGLPPGPDQAAPAALCPPAAGAVASFSDPAGDA